MASQHTSKVYEQELRTLHEHYAKLCRMAKRDLSLTQSHSVEEAEARHERKIRGLPKLKGEGEPEAAPRKGDSPRKSS